MSPPEISEDEQRRIDEELWKSLTMLSQIFPGKELNIYNSTTPDLDQEERRVLHALHCFAALSVRSFEVVAASVGEQTAARLSLLICKTNDVDTAESGVLPTATYSVAKNTVQDPSRATDEITYQTVGNPNLPLDEHGERNINYIMANKWLMSWEEHISFLAYFRNYASQANTPQAKELFIRYCLLAQAPKNDARLCKTPLAKRNISFLHVIKGITGSDVGSFKIASLPYPGDLITDPITALNFLTMTDLENIHALLDFEPFRALRLTLLSAVAGSESPGTTVLTSTQQATLAAELWELFQHCLITTEETYSTILQANKKQRRTRKKPVKIVLPTATLVEEANAILFRISDFLTHALYQSKWLEWLLTEHVSKSLADAIRVLLDKSDNDTDASDLTEPYIQGDEDCEVNDTSTLGTSQTVLASKVLAYVKLAYCTQIQAEEVLKHGELFKNLEVHIVTCPHVEGRCTPWKDAIYEAYKLAGRENPKETAAARIAKIEHLCVNGTEEDQLRLKFANPELPWKFTGAVHCECQLASELVKKAKAATSGKVPEISEVVDRSISRYIGPSKRCCPMCSIILNAISGEADGPEIPILFQHSQPFPSALPPNLPRSIRQRAIRQLSMNLCRALNNFYIRSRTGSHGSQQSHAVAPETKARAKVSWNADNDKGKF
ncbi:hypothetical protein BJ508DRAFT_84991 [Ascobolus immersus RN42]|uniref:Uncharacterized protein n=1 Tax=Ascobolus immersus RN42 TaxID=1160509 RepID=A0A3N4HBK7_ASCIM|nr:hypothetical protein BJ508DRAFT_84991 [Ascobolus immersus RN42]